MVEFDDSGETTKIGTIRFLDGRVARSPEEKGKALAEKEAYWRSLARENLALHLSKKHPEGLAQLKTTDGQVIRPGGARSWQTAQ